MLTHLFVYGTLLSKSNNEFAKYLKSNSLLVNEATCQGQLYRISWYPGMILSTNPNDVVFGQLLEIIGDTEDVFGKLDDYEGMDQTNKEQNEYRREIINVQCKNQTYKSWAYLYAKPLDSFERITNGRFDF